MPVEHCTATNIGQYAGYLAALVALVIGRWTYRQNLALRISDKRQQWLDNLRSDLARYMHLCSATVDPSLVDTIPEGDAKKEYAKKLSLLLAEKEETLFRIRLRLNPDNPKHEQLYKEITLFGSLEDLSQYRVVKERVFELSIELIQATWKKIVEGK